MEQKPNPMHQENTHWIGERYFIEGVALSPDDPEFKRWERMHRRAAARRQAQPKKRGVKKKK